MTTHRNGFEGQTSGTTVTLLNSANSGDAFTNVNINGGSIVYSNARAASGTISLLITPAAASTCYVDDASFSSTQLVTSFCFYYGAAPSAAVTIFQARTAAGGSFGMNIGTNGKLTSTDSAGATATQAANALTSGHWYRIEIQGFSDATTGTIAFQYFLDNAGSAIESLSASSKNTRGGNITTARYGTPTGSTGYASYTYDNVQTADGTLTALGAMANPPVAAFTYLRAGLGLTVDGSTSTFVSPATSITGYDWDWGDGTTHSTGATPAKHTYAAAGIYTVVLTVTDNNGLTDTSSQTITMEAPASTVTVERITLSTGWTASTGTALTCITDGDPTTFLTSSSNPSALALNFVLKALIPVATGQPLKVFITTDALLSTSAHVDATLWEGATQRSSITGTVIASGSGSTVGSTIAITFPYSDLASVTTGGWNALEVKSLTTAV